VDLEVADAGELVGVRLQNSLDQEDLLERMNVKHADIFGDGGDRNSDQDI
jgi:hypothetical protein